MEEVKSLKPIRKTYSLIGFFLCIFFATTFLLQTLFAGGVTLAFGKESWFFTSTWGKWIISYVPMYLIAFPLFALLMKLLPAQKPQDNKIGFGKMAVYFFISYAVVYAGSIIGNVLSFVFSGGKAQNQVAEIAMETSLLKIVVVVVLAPLIEELIFRKLLIDRTVRFGEKTAVILSAFTFALLHQNLFQFFYAFGVGVIFAYIYVRSGRVRYSVILHVIINFMGSVVAPWIVSLYDYDALVNVNPNISPEEILAVCVQVLPGLILFLLYAFILFGVVITGLVLFIINLSKTTWKDSEEQLEKGTVFKTVYLNAGMILYVILCLVFVVISLF